MAQTENAKINYYEIMELTPQAADELTIRSRYNELKSFYASGTLIDKGILVERELVGLQEMLEEAYAVLGNPTLKAIYDEKLNICVSSEKIINPVAIVKESTLPVSDLKEIKRPCFEHERKMWKLSYPVDEAKENYFQQLTQWDGYALAALREYKKVSISDLSQFTKINPFYITAVEQMLPNQLPAHVFVRGYIVQIARALGLNAEKVASSYMSLYVKTSEQTKNISL